MLGLPLTATASEITYESQVRATVGNPAGSLTAMDQPTYAAELGTFDSGGQQATITVPIADWSSISSIGYDIKVTFTKGTATRTATTSMYVYTPGKLILT